LKPDEAAEIEKLAKSRGISGIEFRG
jgi:hypothetical protein